MSDRDPTAAERKAARPLLELLPGMEAKGFEAAPSWGGGETSPGVFHMPYPNYCEEIGRFIQLAHDEALIDREYVDKDVGEWLRRPAFVEQATLADVKSILTFMVRGERFCDGHIAALFGEGHVVAVLRRLAVIIGEE